MRCFTHTDSRCRNTTQSAVARPCCQDGQYSQAVVIGAAVIYDQPTSSASSSPFNSSENHQVRSKSLTVQKGQPGIKAVAFQLP